MQLAVRPRPIARLALALSVVTLATTAAFVHARPANLSRVRLPRADEVKRLLNVGNLARNKSLATTLTVQNVNSQGVADKGRCLTMPAGRFGTYECGFLRLAYALPTTKTLGRSWTPTLTFNSEHLGAAVRLAVNVGVSSTTTIDSIQLKAYWGSGDTITRWVTLANDGQTRRVVLELLRDSSVNAPSSFVTAGINHYTVVGKAYGGGSVQATTSDTGTFVFVDRRDPYNARFGSGWWLSGLEQLGSVGSPEMLWTGGDGSTRIYKQAGSSNSWLATPTIDRPDTLQRLITINEYEYYSDTIIKWRRLLPNAAYVEFDNSGRHTSTVNAQGYQTRFTYGASGLDSIVLPMPSGASLKRAYKLERYTDTVGCGGLCYSDRLRIKAPTVNGSQRITDINFASFYIFRAGDATGTVSIKNPKSETITYNVSAPAAPGFWVAVTDRAGKSESLLMTGDALLRSSTDVLWTDPDHVLADTTVVTSFYPAERASLGPYTCSGSPQTGCGGWKLPADVRTIVDLPRTDIDDTVRFAVHRFGGVTLIRDPLGNETTVNYADSRFPALVTSVVRPGGFTEQQAYNGRGLVDSSIAVSPYGGSNAITKYTWHSSRPLLTGRTDPTGGVTSFSYDSYGNKSWQQVGTSSATRVNFSYDSDNRLEYVQAPNHTTSQREHIQYDALLGNVSRITTPIGFYTDYTTDSIGRVIVTSSPVDSANTTRRRDSVVYDALDRVVKSIPGATASSLIDSTTYDAEGRVTARRTSGPSMDYPYASMVYSSHTWTYDAVGRLSAEGGPGGSRTYKRDLAGNELERAGVKLQYDALGRLTRRIAPGSSSGASCHPMISSVFSESCTGSDLAFPMYGGSTFVVPTDTATFTYDATGNILTADNVDGRIKRSYYANGQLKTDTLRIRTYTRTSNPTTDFSTHAYGLQYEYDLSGRRKKLYHPVNLGYGCGSSCYQSYAYDTLTGRLTGTTSIRGHSFTFGYDDEGRVVSTAGPGGTNQAFTYDIDGRMTHRLDRRGLTTIDTVHRDWRSFDAAARVLKDTTAGLSALRQVTTNTYNTVGQLATSTYHQLSPDKTIGESWTLDVLGNAAAYTKVLSSTTIFRTTAFDAGQNWLHSSTEGDSYGLATTDDTWYGMDTYGRMNLTAVRRRSPYPYNYERVYTWSWYDSTGAGRLYAFQRQGLDTAVDTRAVLEEYRYDALGRRIMVRSRARSTCATPFCKSAVERYVWDGNRVLYEVRVPGDNSLSSSALEVDTASGPYYGRIGYVHAGGIDTPLALDRDGLVVIPHNNWRGLYDAGTDTLGASCCSTVDWPGKNFTAYLAGGMVRSPTGWAGSLITGRQDQSGMMYRVNRYYDPTSGRFTQTDPIGLAGGLNTYGFASADPINRVDPFGLEDESYPLPPQVIEQLGELCKLIDCKKVNVLPSAACVVNSFSLGYDICIKSSEKCDLSSWAHELYHTYQYKTMGRVQYYNAAAWDWLRDIANRFPLWELGETTPPPPVPSPYDFDYDIGVEYEAQQYQNTHGGNACG